jgi:hypothetical protein
MTLKEMTLVEMTVNEMTLVEMTLNEMSVNEVMTLVDMTVDQITCCPKKMSSLIEIQSRVGLKLFSSTQTLEQSKLECSSLLIYLGKCNVCGHSKIIGCSTQIGSGLAC